MNRNERSSLRSVLSLFVALLLIAQNVAADERPTYFPSRHENDDGKPALLSLHAHPYALATGNGIVNVRFSVRMMGRKNPSTAVFLCRSDVQESFAINDQSVNGNHRAGENIYRAGIPIDTSTKTVSHLKAAEFYSFPLSGEGWDGIQAFNCIFNSPSPALPVAAPAALQLRPIPCGCKGKGIMQKYSNFAICDRRIGQTLLGSPA